MKPRTLLEYARARMAQPGFGIDIPMPVFNQDGSVTLGQGVSVNLPAAQSSQVNAPGGWDPLGLGATQASVRAAAQSATEAGQAVTRTANDSDQGLQQGLQTLNQSAQDAQATEAEFRRDMEIGLAIGGGALLLGVLYLGMQKR